MPTTEQLIEEAIGHHRAGDLSRAELLYREAIGRAEHPVALQNLGILLRATGRVGEAVAMLRRATVAAPRAHGAWYNLGNAVMAAGDAPAAVGAYEKAAWLNPGDVDTLSNLGLALRASRRLEEGEAVFRRAAERAPGRADVLTNWGAVLTDLKRHVEAIALLERAALLDPRRAETQHDLALAYHAARRFGEAVEAAGRAISLWPDYSPAHAALGNVLHDIGDLGGALAAYRRAIELAPGDLVTQSNYLLALVATDAEPQAIFDAHVAFGGRFGRAAALPAVDVGVRRVRVGYFSPDFREHAVAHFVEPLLAQHDREAFEVVCYCDALPDAVTARLAGYGHRFVDVRGLSDSELVARARGDGLDIAVDLAGHTAGNRLAAFAARMAPVQITGVGYSATTGVAAMDFRLTDALADPPGESDRFCTERLLRLPRCAWCYRPSDVAPAVSPLPGGIVFGSFNHARKLSPRTLALWAEVLGAVEGSTLVLKAAGLADAAASGRVLAAFARAGVGGERITILPHALTVAGHLAAYACMGVALDAVEYNGTTTTCEALYMGVPVITLTGRTHASRVGTSLLVGAGLPQLVAADGGAFVRLAAALAADRAGIGAMRSSLRDRLVASALCDVRGYTRAVEAAFREAVVLRAGI